MPCTGFCTPAMQSKNVVFPGTIGPDEPVHGAGQHGEVTLSTAVTPPTRWVTPRLENRGSLTRTMPLRSSGRLRSRSLLVPRSGLVGAV